MYIDSHWFVALAHHSATNNSMRAGGAESLVGVLGRCTSLDHLDLSCFIGATGAQRVLQEYWGSVQDWLFLISITIASD